MNLKEIRIMRNLKVQEVSDFLCCLPSVYSRYETGKREPSVDVLLKLSRLYGVSVDYLIGNDEVVDTSLGGQYRVKTDDFLKWWAQQVKQEQRNLLLSCQKKWP